MDEPRFDLRRLYEEHRFAILFFLLGFFLLSIGVLAAVIVSLNQAKPQIEVLEQVDEKEGEDLVVDVSGAVEKPGIYRLPTGSRVNDVLTAAGGLASDADRDWVNKYINLAQMISDGIKVYIPKMGEVVLQNGAVSSVGSGVSGGEVIGVQAKRTVNINTASIAELDSLWGIGEKRAKAIIDQRPYSGIEELLEKGIIPSNVFERIKGEISVY